MPVKVTRSREGYALRNSYGAWIAYENDGESAPTVNCEIDPLEATVVDLNDWDGIARLEELWGAPLKRVRVRFTETIEVL